MEEIFSFDVSALSYEDFILYFFTKCDATGISWLEACRDGTVM